MRYLIFTQNHKILEEYSNNPFFLQVNPLTMYIIMLVTSHCKLVFQINVLKDSI